MSQSASATLDEAIDLYRERFANLPTISGISRVLAPRIARALAGAVTAGKPLTDLDLYRALDLEPPGAGADL